MGKVAAVLVVVLALAAEVLFLLTRAGHPLADPTPLASALGPLAGSPALAGIGALLFALGVALAARPTEPGGTFAHREAAFAVSAAVAWGFTVAALVGVERGWSAPTLAVLGGGAAVETAVALGFAVRLGFVAGRRKLIFVPALVCTIAVALLCVGLGLSAGGS